MISVQRIVFSARSSKTCMVVVAVFVVLLLNVLESPINYAGGCYSGKKEKKLLLLRTLSIAWNIEVHQILASLLAFSFWWPQLPSCPFHSIFPECCCKKYLPSQSLGEEQTSQLALRCLISDTVTKGRRWIFEALHAWQFSVVCENCRDKTLPNEVAGWRDLGNRGEWEGEVAALTMTLSAIVCF